jgi:Flp pilus assembly protein TadD
MTYGRYALALAPDHAPALLLVADVLDQQNRWTESNALFARIPARDPLSWPARLRIAENLYQLKQADEAAAMLEAMAAERPDRIDALMALGQIRRLQERYADAAEVYSRAVARIGGPQTRHWALFYARGIAYERSKQWPAAEADFLKALELQPEQPDVMNYLAYSWVDMNMHLDRAFPMLERAVELRPNSGHIIDSLAWALYRKGRYDEAVPLMERAVELLPQDPVILDHLGDIYWRVGRTAEARFSWRRSLGNKPEAELKAELERKLAQGLPPTPQAQRVP